MDKGSFPSIYCSAEALSRKSQNCFFLLLGSYLILLIAATASTELVEEKSIRSILLLLFLLASIGCTAALALWTPQQKWYSARALAESVKTVSWRYVTRAEPYENDADANQEFIEVLRRLRDDHKSLPLEPTDGPAITDRMREIRQKPWLERKGLYEQNRIDDQLRWYRKKSRLNSCLSKLWYFGVIVLHVLAILVLVLALWSSSNQIWLVNILLTLAASAMAWLQTKKFQELAASYALTAHEIEFLKSSIQDVRKETDFSAFVGDSENAFSREHTQWRARRDMA